MRNLTITVIQPDIKWQSPSDNLKKYGEVVSSISMGSDLVLFPEMFTTGFTMKPQEYAEEMNGDSVSAMKEWSRGLNAYVAGSLIIKENGKFFNRFVAVSPDGGVQFYDKRHLFRMAGEDKIYSPGSENITLEINGWKIRPFICYDLRFPVWSRNSSDGYDLALYCANWPAARAFHWETLLRARAVENLCYVAGVNRTGSDGNGVKYSGGTSIIGYRGETIYSAGDESAVHSAELSYRGLMDYRREFPAWMDADQFRVVS